MFNLLFQEDCLTIVYATFPPPEYQLSNRCYPNGAEMWALGVMLYQFLTDNHYIDEEKTKEWGELNTKLQRKVLLQKLEGVFSIKVQTLLKYLLGWSAKRITIDNVLRNDWVVNGPTNKQ